MSTCAKCSATPADYFSPQGDALCRVCFLGARQRQANDRAAASIADTGVAGVRYSTEPETPKKALVAGAILVAVGVGLGVLFVFLTGKLYFWFVLIALAGLASIARGIMLARR